MITYSLYVQGYYFHKEDIKAIKFVNDDGAWCEIHNDITPFSDEVIQTAKSILFKDDSIYDVEGDRWYNVKKVATMTPTSPQFKYDEERLLKEFNEYVANTYSSHYVGEDNIQSLDLIFGVGHGEGFCCGNILKYGARQGKKPGTRRNDIFKILHYALLLLYWHDKQVAKNEKYKKDDGGYLDAN